MPPPPPPEQSGVLSSTIRLSRAIRRLIKSYFRFNKRQVSQIKVGRGGGGGAGVRRNNLEALVRRPIREGALWLAEGPRDGPCERAAHRIVRRGQEGKEWRERREWREGREGREGN